MIDAFLRGHRLALFAERVVSLLRAGRSNLSESVELLVNALLRDVNLVDRLRCRVVDLGTDGGLADAHAFLVDELDEVAALFVCHG